LHTFKKYNKGKSQEILGGCQIETEKQFGKGYLVNIIKTLSDEMELFFWFEDIKNRLSS
jgi:hypothetical protein